MKFWHNRRCSVLPLKMLYPELFSIVRESEASVASLLSFRNGALHWDIIFFWNIQDWQLESLISFMDLIYSLRLDGNGVDKFCWNRNEKMGFSVQSYYNCLTLPLEA